VQNHQKHTFEEMHTPLNVYSVLYSVSLYSHLFINLAELLIITLTLCVKYYVTRGYVLRGYIKITRGKADLVI
jgi:hypothetical protein